MIPSPPLASIALCAFLASALSAQETLSDSSLTASTQEAPLHPAPSGDLAAPAPPPSAESSPGVASPQAAPAPIDRPRSSQEARSRRTHGFGAAAGFVSGYGLSYRHWSPETRHGYQVTTIPIAHIDDEESFLNLSLGGMGLFSMHESRRTNFFAYYGAHYMGFYDETSWDDDAHAGQALISGGGFGMELLFWDRHLNVSFMLGYAGMNVWEKNTIHDYGTSTDPNEPYVDRTRREWEWSFTMQPTVEVGAFYGF